MRSTLSCSGVRARASREPFLAEDALHVRNSGLRRGRIMIDEHQPGREARTERDPGLAGKGTQPGVRPIQQDAAAVAGDPVSVHTPAMRHPRERAESLVDEPAARPVADLGNEPEAAAVVFESGVIQARRVATRHAAILAVPRNDRSSAMVRDVLG